MMYTASASKGTHATKLTKNATGSRGPKRAPYLLMTVIAVTLALCATTQVFAIKLNNTILPPLSLSIDDALQYLSRASNKHLDEKYSPLFKNESTMNESERSSALLKANSILDYFFEESEANSNNNSHEGVRLLIKENAARFIQQPSSEVASQAIGLLKSESVSAESADDEEESQMVKIDRSFMQRLFGVITASMIAVSAYAYLV